MSNSIIVFVPPTVELSAVFSYYSLFGDIIELPNSNFEEKGEKRLVQIAYTNNQAASQALMNVAEHKINGVQMIVQPGGAATHSQVFPIEDESAKKASSGGTSASAGKAPAKKKKKAPSSGTGTSAGKAPAKKKTSGGTSAGQAGEASTSASAGSLPVSVAPVPDVFTEAELAPYFEQIRSGAYAKK